MFIYNFCSKTFFKPPLSKEEQNRYFKLAKQGNERAKEIILEHNLRSVAFVINRYYQNLDEENIKDLFSVGCLELWNCIEKFNINFKNEFSTYAIPSILGSMKRYLRENNLLHVSKKLRDISINILNIEKEYEDKNNGKQISINELSKILAVPKKDIILAKNVNQPVESLSCPINQSDCQEISIGETIADENFIIYEDLEKKELYNDLMCTLYKLPEKERITIISLFGLGEEKKKQKEISQLLNLSQSAISRLKVKALKKLKDILPSYIKEEYQKKYVISKK